MPCATGHHLDLMFSHADDPLAVTHARKFELEQVEQWIQDYEQGAVQARCWGDLTSR